MIKKLLPFLALAAALAVGYWSFDWAVGAVIHDRPVVMVPDLTGKGVADALNLLGQGHLGLIKDGEQFDKRFPAGTVVRQNPPAGMMVREGRLIRITLSQGGETLFVPDLVGQPMRNAQTNLQNVGLSVGEMERRPSLRYEKDSVMATDPPASSVVSKNALISLIISDGPPGADVLLMPDFMGKQLSDVKNWTASHQVTLSTRDENDITKPSGEILQQFPTADTPVRPGDTLTVVSNTSSASAQGPHVHYEVPQGSSDVDIKVLVIDENGEQEVYRKGQSPGSKIDFNVQPKGHAKARIFMNGIMVEEQELQ